VAYVTDSRVLNEKALNPTSNCLFVVGFWGGGGLGCLLVFGGPPFPSSFPASLFHCSGANEKGLHPLTLIPVPHGV